MNENSKISVLKGIGEKTEQAFQKLNLYTITDLIHYYPRGYDVYEEPIPISEVEEGRVQTICGHISGSVQVNGNRKMQVTTIYVRDESNTIKAIWFRMPFLRSTLKGGNIILRGRVIYRKGELMMEHPELFYPVEQYHQKVHTLQPIYPLTTGITNNTIMKAIRQCFESYPLPGDPLPSEVVAKYDLAEYGESLRNIHFPTDKECFYQARKRLVTEEFIQFILAIRKMKEKGERTPNSFPMQPKEQVDQFLAQLPYQLTNAQQKVWQDLKQDVTGPYAMSRLIQGDVGSGKTIVALLALMLAVYNGYQGAMMAPTEVLARQHYDSITKMFEEYGISFRVQLLTGSMKVKEKRRAYDRIACGLADIVIGTHALIQDQVEYDNLGLVITDEQHRFGVKQREAFLSKGNTPHVLVMSATPIPRTLAIILYGDLDISVIDELPSNRLPIKNCVVDTNYRKTAYGFIKDQVGEGRQCYVICPMVEESETLEVENVTDYAKTLQAALGEAIKVECLHGKMKQNLKDDIMERFALNEIQVLVSTTVIEVGINVPNATVMMVENAERFGLAQLHQLRGRVGRGGHQSYCIFMSGSKSKETKKRLEILNKSNDGFFISSEDLKMRGPGDLFGIRQSGLMDFSLGDIFQDAALLQQASEIVANEDLEQYEKISRVKGDNLHIL